MCAVACGNGDTTKKIAIVSINGIQHGAGVDNDNANKTTRGEKDASMNQEVHRSKVGVTVAIRRQARKTVTAVVKSRAESGRKRERNRTGRNGGRLKASQTL
jgi:hypothetical protein